MMVVSVRVPSPECQSSADNAIILPAASRGQEPQASAGCCPGVAPRQTCMTA